MNSLELIVAIAVALLLGWRLVKASGFNLESIVIVAIIVTGIFLLFDRVSQFFTYDETYFFWEATSIATCGLSQWLIGALRTSDILVGSVMHAIRATTSLPFAEYQMLAKMTHALFGITCIGFIWILLARLLRERIQLSVTAFLVLIAFQPMLLMSMKIITYDMFSMLLGIAAVLLIGIGAKEKNIAALFCAIIASFLASQEKVIASPLLWISIVVYGWESARNSLYETRFRRIIKVFTRCCLVFCIAIAANIGSHIILLINRGPDSLDQLMKLDLFFYPIYSFVYILVRTLGGDSFASIYVHWMLDSGIAWACAITGMAIVALFIVSILLTLADSHHVFDRRWIKSFKEILPTINGLLFLLFLLLAVFSWLFLEGYTFPRIKIPQGCYIPPASFNGVSVFFMAKSLAGHWELSYLWANLWFIIAISSVVPIGLLISWISNRITGTRSQAPAFLEFMMFISLLAPLAYATSQTPALNRYFNMFILIIALVTAVRLSESLAKIRKPARTVIITLLFIIAAVEIYPFRPLFGSFRPFWYNLPENMSRHQVFPTKPVWTGWGEEVMLAGKKIKQNYLKGDTRQATLYFNFIGDWVRKDDNITVTSVMTRIADAKYMQVKDSLIHANAVHDDTLSYTSRDFYIINRQGLLYQKDIPETINPLFTIGFRGFTQAWVYRGDQLAATGFTF
nr:hypothetical protein [uncultured Gammaproteobacteria bacterium]